MRVPLLLISPEFADKRLKRLRGISRRIAKFFPSLKKDLNKAYIYARPEGYVTAALFSSLMIAMIAALIAGYSSYLKGDEIERVLFLSDLIFPGVFILAILILVKYPAILANKIAEDTDRHLVFALKDMLLHTSTGTSLYDAIISVSRAGYGEISRELELVGREIHSGKAEDKALESLANRTSSVYLKKIIWQILNSMRTGGNISDALKTIVDDLVMSQKVSIAGYANELNLWSLIYMLFAVAAPTIGITMMIILSSFANVGITETTLIMFVCTTLFVQIVIIGLIKSRRPGVEF